MQKVAALIGAIVLLVLGTGAVVVLAELRELGSLGFTKSVKVTSPDQDRGYYYRFRANLTESFGRVRGRRRIKYL
jgi:phosphodiesterase/alkaline phosphatase D-like protein